MADRLWLVKLFGVLRLHSSQSANCSAQDDSKNKQRHVRQIMIEEIVEECDVQDTVDDGGVGECGSGF